MPNVHDDDEETLDFADESEYMDADEDDPDEGDDNFVPEIPGTFVRPGHPGDINDPERWPE